MTDLHTEKKTKEKVFEIWANKESHWAPWVKPVLFAGMHFPSEEPVLPERGAVDLSWVKKSDRSIIYVLDLPGIVGALTGLEFARFGFRPIPLYNSLPSPPGYVPSADDEGGSVVAQVNVQPIVDTLWAGTSILKECNLAPTALPVFILDSNRRVGTTEIESGDFDNRSISFPTDFPSVNFLLSQNISKVILVQREGSQPQEDLSQTLRRWQDAGISIELKLLDSDGNPTPLTVKAPSKFRIIFLHALAFFGRGVGPQAGFGKLIGDGAGG